MLKDTLNEILSIVTEPVIAGGFAVAHYTRPAETADLDVIGLKNIASYSTSLKAFGYSQETIRLENGITLESFTKGKHTRFEEGIDFMWFKDEAFEQQVIARALPSKMLGKPVKIISIEDLIVMKSLSSRTKDKAHLEELQKKPHDKEYVIRCLGILLKA
ncbi:MAG: nucleotidyltransferase [Deltaproteobacteria bacterium]|nr:nucleotidyltransferase [Deltaproteobacteria bacterium]